MYLKMYNIHTVVFLLVGLWRLFFFAALTFLPVSLKWGCWAGSCPRVAPRVSRWSHPSYTCFTFGNQVLGISKLEVLCQIVFTIMVRAPSFLWNLRPEKNKTNKKNLTCCLCASTNLQACLLYHPFSVTRQKKLPILCLLLSLAGPLLYNTKLPRVTLFFCRASPPPTHWLIVIHFFVNKHLKFAVTQAQV